MFTDTNAPDCADSKDKEKIRNHQNAKTIGIFATSAFKGSAAASLGLDWDNWQVNTTGYPTPKKETITITGDNYVAKNPTDKWDGTAATYFAAGFGTAEDPWIIETAEQFYLMVSTKDATDFYKIANGVEALYFNNVEGKTYSQAMAYLKGNSALNYAPGEKNSFSGYFDGNGATIYGVRTVGSAETVNVGLFPQVGQNATIKNITLKHSYFTMSLGISTGGAGGIVGSLDRKKTSCGATIRNNAVIECKIEATGQTAAAAIIGNTVDSNSSTSISNCLVANCEVTSAHIDSKFAAIVAGGWHPFSRSIDNCLTIGTYPTSGYESSYSPDRNTYRNVYTDTAAPNDSSASKLQGYINKISTDSVKGEAAKTTLVGFDWENQWQTGDKYPTPRVFVAATGTPGEPWSGFSAEYFIGGTGTKNDPYLIDTAERFRYMLDHAAEGRYYALTEDIYLNDVTADNWYESADVKSWLTSKDISKFCGRLDGQNHTVYGLYGKDIPAGVSAGLLPVFGSSAWVRNLNIDKAYITGAAGSNIGAVAGSAESNASKVMSIRGCEIKEDVILNGGGNVAGIIGYVGVSAIRIDNVAFKGQIIGNCGSKGGIVAASEGATTVKASFSVGIEPLGGTSGYSTQDVYSNVPGGRSDITVLTDEQMKGEDAKTYMSALAWEDGAWKTVTDGYPVLGGTLKPTDGVAGEVWSGDTAASYAGGSGTADDPWQIATGEQLYKMYMDEMGDLENAPQHHFILTADILLNDVNSEFWAAQVGLNSWSGKSQNFRGTFDGQGHVIVGLYRNEKDATVNRLALFPGVSDGAVIKRTGLSYAYLSQKLPDDSESNGFTAGFVALVDDWDGDAPQKDAVTDGTEVYPESTQDFVNGEFNGKKAPIISECFVDHNSYIQGNHAGGIVCATRGGIIVENCYFTGTLKVLGQAGAIVGNGWAPGIFVTNCFVASQTSDRFSSGSKFNEATESSNDVALKGNYAYSMYAQYGVTRIKSVKECYGKANYDIMAKSEKNPDGMDFENIWMMVEDGTPVLRVFNHTNVTSGVHHDKDNIRTAEAYSCKNVIIPKSEVILQTGTSETTYEPLVGEIFSPLELPTPTRAGYAFTGWYVYPEYQCEYDCGYFPPRNLTLFAGWEANAIIIGFENFTNTMYDIDYDHWVFNRPGVKGGYKTNYIHGGGKSIHRLDTEGEQDCVLNYKDTLTVGQSYSMTFWVATDKPNTKANLSLVHNTWPDYLEPTLGVEPMVTVQGLKVGKWTQYKYNFTAKTQWISLRTTGGASLYFDDFIISPTGTLIENNNDVINLGTGSTATLPTSPNSSPNTGDSVAPIVALVATIVACAVVMLVSKKGCVEVIEK